MRKIDYLRISVTDKCNLRCVYCMPEEGVKFISHDEILSFEEILYLISVFSEVGIKKVRITGGEPLVRKDVAKLIEKIAKLDFVEDLSMTTNGILLSEFAMELFDAGLNRINISIDTLDSEQYKRITRKGSLEKLLKGIDSVIEAGFQNIKLNTVIMNGINTNQILPLTNFALEKNLIIRFIEYMPINGDREKFFPASKMINQLRSVYSIKKVDRTFGNGPAVYYKIENFETYVGFITAMSNHFCSSCNRMRLTSDGKLRPCLLSNMEIDIKNILRSNDFKKKEKLKDKFYEAIGLKPVHHKLVQEDIGGRRMYGIGG